MQCLDNTLFNVVGSGICICPRGVLHVDIYKDFKLQAENRVEVVLRDCTAEIKLQRRIRFRIALSPDALWVDTVALRMALFFFLRVEDGVVPVKQHGKLLGRRGQRICQRPCTVIPQVLHQADTGAVVIVLRCVARQRQIHQVLQNLDWDFFSAAQPRKSRLDSVIRVSVRIDRYRHFSLPPPASAENPCSRRMPSARPSARSKRR